MAKLKTGTTIGNYTAWHDGLTTSRSYVFAHKTAANTTLSGSGTPTTVPFDNVVTDNLSEFTTSNYNFTAKSDGIYIIQAAVALTTSSANQITYMLAVQATMSGSAYSYVLDQNIYTVAGTMSTNGSVVLYLKQNDTFYISVQATYSSNTINIATDGASGSGRNTYLTVTRIA